MGFSGSGYNDYLGAFCAGRISTDPPSQMSIVKTLKSGEAAYLCNQWGDYSHTTPGSDQQCRPAMHVKSHAAAKDLCRPESHRVAST